MEWPKWTRRLLVRILLLLSLALLPIGLIAVYQTGRVATAAELNARLALLALTDKAASEEQQLIQRAFGSAVMLGTFAESTLIDSDACNAHLNAFVQDDPSVLRAAVINASGATECSSTGSLSNIANTPNFQSWLQNPEAIVQVDLKNARDTSTVLTVWQPFFSGEALRGFVSVSTRHTQAPDEQDVLRENGLVNLITFNLNGAIITAHSTVEDAQVDLPTGFDFSDMEVRTARPFRAEDTQGNQRLYTISHVQGSPITVMGVWDTTNPVYDGMGDVLPAATFPVLMWLASLAVAMLALHTLVLRHVNRLRGHISRFEETRAVPEHTGTHAMPTELDEVYSNFYNMSETIVREEARMEDLLRDKNVLIKEVHHRVKNNLQMICSIMNMQIGSAKHAETRYALERLQDRVLSLATIHRDLYQSQNKGQVQATPLVAEIISKSVELAQAKDSNIQLVTSYDPLMLYPDQAVPLSLLVSEVITNAIKYLSAAPGQVPRIEVSLKHEDETVSLRIANSIGGPHPDVDGTGMGTRLMQGFAMQLGGKLETQEQDHHYIAQIQFRATDTAPEAVDY